MELNERKTNKNVRHGNVCCSFAVYLRITLILVCCDCTFFICSFIKTLTGKSISLFADESDTILTLKERFYDKESVPPKEQRLIFKGKILQDGLTLADYNIQAGASINIIFNLTK